VIDRCFNLFPGVGPKARQVLRDAGIVTWQDFLRRPPSLGLPGTLCAKLDAQLPQWMQALDDADAMFFADHLPKTEHWRLFEMFRDSVRYLDIETTGLSAGYHDVTVVGISDGKHYQSLVLGQTLDHDHLLETLDGCKLLITYFGRTFDVPFLRKTYPDIAWNYPHFDLCFAGRKVGLRGGLKNIEITLGLARPESIRHIDGFEAVRLWHRHQAGDPQALETLIAYNRADTENLAVIAPVVYERLCQK